ncbi:PTS sugar transporter subunit IIA [uncultured Subdoligranulum sp.]|uniref:PTS sugar transporter subunit IIA n=1 Tax=uncultured Subdoligranulum sp. TaxID=512298 RepID=UPI00262DEEA3|nr:PTS sugar transporter subunit IIA [uncultured Subdoligranulum sp.]
MKVSELMDPKGILLYANINNAADALGILVELQEGIGVITNGTAYYNAVYQRENFGGTTAIGDGIALPHAGNAGVSAPGVSALTLRRGVDWGAPDGRPVDLLFMIAVPQGEESLHLQILARLVNLLSRNTLVDALRHASSPQRFLELLQKAENACFGD